jgi:hypothetical protein
MKKLFSILIFLIIILIASPLWAEEGIFINADYNVPIGNELVDPNLSFGIGYGWWGVWTVSAQMYTDITEGGDNIFNIEKITPLGLFSLGIGLHIPMGGIQLLIDYDKFLTGASAEDGVFFFCDSYKIGLELDISDEFGVEVYSRKLFNFTPEAIADDALRIESAHDTVDTVGAGLVFHLD